MGATRRKRFYSVLRHPVGYLSVGPAISVRRPCVPSSARVCQFVARGEYNRCRESVRIVGASCRRTCTLVTSSSPDAGTSPGGTDQHRVSDAVGGLSEVSATRVTGGRHVDAPLSVGWSRVRTDRAGPTRRPRVAAPNDSQRPVAVGTVGVSTVHRRLIQVSTASLAALVWFDDHGSSGRVRFSNPLGRRYDTECFRLTENSEGRTQSQNLLGLPLYHECES
jgi:hypothetical protein